MANYNKLIFTDVKELADKLNRIQNHIQETFEQSNSEVEGVENRLKELQGLVNVLYAFIGLLPQENVTESSRVNVKVEGGELVYRDLSGNDLVVTRNLDFLTSGLDRLNDNIRTLANRVTTLEEANGN